MSDVEERLARLRQAGRLQRRASRPQPARPPARPSPPPSSHIPPLDDLLALPGMEEIEGSGGRFLLRTARYELAHRQGQGSLGELLDLPAGAARMAGREAALSEFDFRRVAFLDTETSGLAGGAGTIVFLTGVGRFEDDGYVVRQYFARNPAEEPAYLRDLGDLLAEVDGLVTFNGKSFDLPLLRGRFIMAGLQPPETTLPHLDLLHPARRLWRERLGACNFGNLEIQILGHRRSGQDVPSWMIPSLWFRFASDGSNATDMARVLYHNQEDIVSMAPLAAALCGVFSGEREPHPGDLLALARSYTRQGAWAEAEASYRRALDENPTREQRIEIVLSLADVLKRQGQRQKAAVWWQSLAETSNPDVVKPYVELAKHHEWETKDLIEAQRWTERAIEVVSGWRPGYDKTQTLEALNHRRERLRRKLANAKRD